MSFQSSTCHPCAECQAPVAWHPHLSAAKQPACCSRECGTMYKSRRLAERRPERFWAQVERTPTCWLWRGSLNPSGYGRVQWGAERRIASRVAWELTYGPIPEGLFTCHRCDTPACVRPEHLFLGTALDNARDCVGKGRSVGKRGKLPPEAVENIRTRYAADPSCVATLASEYHVSRTHIHSLGQGRHWRNI